MVKLRCGVGHRHRYGRGREEGGGRRRGWRAGRCRLGRVWEEGGLGGGPAAAAMGGRGMRTGRRAGAAAMGGSGRRKGNGEEGGATREGGENEKIGGEHITAGSIWNRW